MLHQKSEIAVFSFAYAPFEGGAEVAVREIMARLSNVNFTVFTHRFKSSDAGIDERENITIMRLGKGSVRAHYYGIIIKKIMYIWRAWQAAEHLHERKRFKMIWAVMASYGGIAALIFKMRHPKIPLLLTIQEGDSELHLRIGKFGLVGLMGTILMRRADHIQVISAYLQHLVRSRGARCPIDVVPNGVDVPLFETIYTDQEMRAVRQEVGVTDEYVVITTSRLVHKNGVDILIRAIAILKEKNVNVRCIILGSGPEERSLRTLAKKLQVEKNIVFLGHIPYRDLPLYMKIADVFVRPSRSEGLGNSFLEAMAAGIPVVGTPVGGITDFLKDRVTGLVAEHGTPDEVAAQAYELLFNKELRHDVIKNGKQLMRQNYTWEIVSRMMKNIFDQIINT
ncbi:MAG: glycosyltransferase family 4 protein [bacterium]|nr:glycosyltransferase family 4 protein [bacterium]